MFTYVVIVGNHTSTKTPVEYVAHIVYGEPEIQAVEVGSHFVALLTYFGEEQAKLAQHTVDRMGSFPHGARLFYENDKTGAMAEFGWQVAHYAPRTAVVNAVV